MSRSASQASPLRVGVVGVGRQGAVRARHIAEDARLRLVGVADADVSRAEAVAAACTTTPYASTALLLDACDAVCVATPTRDHFLLAEAAAKDGRHVFLEWPATTSVDECERLVRLGEEAGVEIGVAHPLPVAALLASRPHGWRPHLVSLHLPADGLSWPFLLAGALDLSVALAGSADLPRLDAEADRHGALLGTVAATLRFRSGTLAHLLLGDAVEAPRLFVAGQGRRATAHRLDAPLAFDDDAPTRPGASAADDGFDGFATALATERPAPRSALDALRTMRLAERLLQKLR
ncbi:MAG: Gfo/Idh/MocA family oxidoreductase [Bacteroidota bacterium]